MSGEDAHLEEAYEDRFIEPELDEEFEDAEEQGDLPGLDIDGEQVPTPTPSGVTVGDNEQNEYGDANRRHLLVLEPLPVYLRDKDHPERGIDLLLQGQMLESDIREAMARAAYKLNDAALKYSVRGYTWDVEDIHYDMPQPRTVAATLVVERG